MTTLTLSFQRRLETSKSAVANGHSLLTGFLNMLPSTTGLMRMTK